MFEVKSGRTGHEKQSTANTVKSPGELRCHVHELQAEKDIFILPELEQLLQNLEEHLRDKPNCHKDKPTHINTHDTVYQRTSFVDRGVSDQEEP